MNVCCSQVLTKIFEETFASAKVIVDYIEFRLLEVHLCQTVVRTDSQHPVLWGWLGGRERDFASFAVLFGFWLS